MDWDDEGFDGYVNVVSGDGGDSWSEIELPAILGSSSPRENEGESYIIGGYNDGQQWRDILYSTTDSWDSWDTLFIDDWCNAYDHIILFTTRNGHIIRFLRDEKTELQFSSDTGRTWTDGQIESDTLPSYGGTDYTAGAGDEFYSGIQGHLYYCVEDSGRDIFKVFDFGDYGPYGDWDEVGNHWNRGEIITTDIPGEFYAIIDSTGQFDGVGINIHVFHVANFGQNFELFRYGMPDWEPVEPEIVNDRLAPAPSLPVLSVFPSPSNGFVTLQIQGDKGFANLEIYDLLGRSLFSEKLSMFGYSNQNFYKTILLPQTSSTYIVIVKSNRTTQRRIITVVQ